MAETQAVSVVKHLPSDTGEAHYGQDSTVVDSEVSTQQSRDHQMPRVEGIQVVYSQQEGDALVRKLRQFERENASLANSLTKICDENARLAQVIAQQQIKCDGLNSGILASAPALRTLFEPEKTGWFGKNKSSRDDLQKLMEDVQREYVEYCASHTSTNEEVQALLAELKSAHVSTQNLSVIVREQQEAISKGPLAVTVRIVSVENENDAFAMQELQRDVERYRMREDELLDQIQVLQAEIEAKVSEVARLEHGLHELRESGMVAGVLEVQQRELKKIVTQLETENEEIRNTLEREKQLHKEKQEDNDALLRAVAELEKQLVEMSQTIAAKETQLAEAQKPCESCQDKQQQYDAVTEGLRAMQSEIVNLSLANEQKSKEVERVSNELQDWLKQSVPRNVFDDLEKENKNIVRELHLATEQLQQIEQALDDSVNSTRDSVARDNIEHHATTMTAERPLTVEKIYNYRALVTQAEHELKCIKKDNDALRELTRSMEREKDQLREIEREDKKQINMLTEQCDQLIEQNDKHQKQKNELQIKQRELQDEIERIQQEMRQLTKLEQRVRELEAENHTLGEQARRADKVAALEQRVRELEAENHTLGEQAQRADKVAALEQRVRELETENHTLGEQAQRVRELEAENHTLGEQAQRADKVAALEQRVRELEAENHTLGEQAQRADKVAALEQRVRELEAENHTLGEQAQRVRELEAENHTLGEQAQRVRELESENHTLGEQAQRADKVAALEQRVRELESENHTLGEQARRADKVAALEQRVRELEAENHTLGEQAQRVRELEAENHTLGEQAQRADKVAALEQRVRELEAENHTLGEQAQRVRELEAENHTLGEQAQRADKVAALEQRVRELEAENHTLGEQAQRVRELEDENHTLGEQAQRVRELEAENHTLGEQAQRVRELESENHTLGEQAQRVRELEDENHTLGEQAQRVRELEDENHTLGEQAQRADKVAALEQRVRELEAENHTLGEQAQRVRELEAENHTLGEQAQRADKVAALEQRVRELEAENHTLGEQAQRVRELEAENHTLGEQAQRVRELEAENHTLGEQARRADKVAALEQRVRELEAENHTLGEQAQRVRELEDENHTLGEQAHRVRELEDENHTLGEQAQRVRELEAENHTLGEQAQRVLKEFETVNEEVESLRVSRETFVSCESHQAVLDDKARCELEMERICGELQSVKAELLVQQNIVSSLELTVAERSSDIETLRALHTKELNDVNVRLAEEMKLHAQTKEQHQRDIDVFVDKHQHMCEEKQQMEELFKQKIAEAKREMAEYKEELCRVMAAAQEQVDNIRQEREFKVVSAGDEEVQRYKVECERLREELCTVEKEKSAMELELVTLLKSIEREKEDVDTEAAAEVLESSICSALRTKVEHLWLC
ncbi:hypothetical protein ERJ75_000244400 [Trypanosoma vivax]|nr:hypothetical protein ERJ75_000244400 [Trypanosoma vivax]